ncbi:tyrosine-type recombinase/integrase [Saccharicrinis sp. 156]|uniref:tyrosine-type recombinase/integrase n=1 Tax=Saccharicrinis sp. 156 TaxID=3417574 RepID=UPI003D357CD0
MENNKQTIDSLLDELFLYFKNAQYHKVTVSSYRSCWNRVKDFMLDNGIKYYDRNVGKAFLKGELGDFVYGNLSDKQKSLVNRTEALYKFQSTGRIPVGGKQLPPKEFEGEIGHIIKRFISYRKETLGLAKKTVHSYTIYLHSFYLYLNNAGIRQIKDFNACSLLSYVKQMDQTASAKQHVTLNILRIFFRYLHEHGILPADYSQVVPKDSYKESDKLPSTFTDEEIKAILNAIDRGSPKGKRDYAMLLIAMRLGLRASDITGLRFENIIWERNVISIEQQKTGEPLELPLLPEIGNAIIDYLKHGRPVSKAPQCFLRAQAPYVPITYSCLGNVVVRYMRLAGINCVKRKHGPHALRHCFASALLKEKVPLPVISELLGHKNMSSSMGYLRVDLASLRECALEVPPVPLSFYNIGINNKQERRI